MKDAKRPAPQRRALLQRGAALTMGALGLGGTAAAAEAGPPKALPGGLRLLARRRTEATPARGNRAPSASSGSYAELLEEPGGPAVGTFHANGLGPVAPLAGLPMAPRLELQTFVLGDGMLFGLGALGQAGERACAVLGGTGRFSGASGTYVEREASDPGAGRGTVEFIFRLNG
jgi:hypothetical protein